MLLSVFLGTILTAVTVAVVETSKSVKETLCKELVKYSIFIPDRAPHNEDNKINKVFSYTI